MLFLPASEILVNIPTLFHSVEVVADLKTPCARTLYSLPGLLAHFGFFGGDVDASELFARVPLKAVSVNPVEMWVKELVLSFFGDARGRSPFTALSAEKFTLCAPISAIGALKS